MMFEVFHAEVASAEVGPGLARPLPFGLDIAASLSPEDRRAAGFSDGLVRYPVGIEDVEDLIAGLRQALDIVSAESFGRPLESAVSNVAEEPAEVSTVSV